MYPDIINIYVCVYPETNLNVKHVMLTTEGSRVRSDLWVYDQIFPICLISLLKQFLKPTPICHRNAIMINKYISDSRTYENRTGALN